MMDVLNVLCPMHVALDPKGRVTQLGPTLEKLGLDLKAGDLIFDAIDIYRPRQIETMPHLMALAGRRLHLRKADDTSLQLKGVFAPDQSGGGVLDVSFGIHLKDAVRNHGLTSTDFSATDLAIEMLYLVEANSAAMEASRRLNARLQTAMFAAEERALTDMLTGLSNRRAMEVLQSRLHRDGQDYALMHIDLDYFKTINDTLGHAAGDAVLRAVSRAMQSEIRKDDTLARVGGDEFVVVFPNAIAASRLGSLATRLIDRIEAPIPVGATQCRVSASIGIAQCTDPDMRPEDVLQNADIALYEAKRAGRSQFRHFMGEQAEEITEQNKEAG